ncbi:MAG: hypothetical protein FJ034_04100 [Chloroflexi bacterium]|nr:hypothetical protein [Chloroflexota bacterium]
MKGPLSFEYARIAVPDAVASRRWYEINVGLDTASTKEGHTYLRAGLKHHALDLVEDRSLPGAVVKAFGFSVESPEVLAEIKERVRKAGKPIGEIDAMQRHFCTPDGSFSTVDPTGMTLEFFIDYQVFDQPPHREENPLFVVHPFIATEKYDEVVAFYLGVLGFKASDYIANVSAFIRSEDRLHHSFAIKRAKTFEVAHICFMVKSFDHLMRARAQAIYRKVQISIDMSNHSASKSIAFYLLDPQHGPRIELCDGHRRLTPEEHATMTPRRMAIDPRNIDIWRAAEDDWHDL